MNKNKAAGYKTQGNDYFNNGDYENALKYYGKAVEINPEYRDAWNNIYLTLLKLDRTDDAKKCKEILDNIEYKPEYEAKKIGDRPYRRLKRILAVVIVLLLALVIIMAVLSIFGWIGYRELIPVAPEQYVSDTINTTLSGFVNIVNYS